jgi:hypothetical protein
MIAIDTETRLVSDIEPVPPMVCAAVTVDDETVVLHHADPDTPGLLRELLQEPVSWANAPFDLAVTSERYPELEPLVWDALREGRVLDVLTRQRLLDLANGLGLKREYGLKQVARRCTGIDLDKANDTYRLRYGELIDVPLVRWPAEALTYAMEDSRATARSGEAQDKVASAFEREHGISPLTNAPAQARAHWAMHLASLHGVMIDPRAVAELDQRMQARLRDLSARLQARGLVRASGVRDTKAAAAMMVASGSTKMTKGGTKPHKKTGLVAPPKVALDNDAIELLHLPSDHPLVEYQLYGAIMTLRSRSLKPFMGREIIRTRFTELVENGRTSSANPNLQNLPGPVKLEHMLGPGPGFRECIVPGPGNVLVIADWSKAELVAWAQVLIKLFGNNPRTSALAKALREGRDPHEEVRAAIGPDTERKLAKAGNFGFMGGAGVERFRVQARQDYGLHLSADEVYRLKMVWRQAWGGDAYFRWVQANLDAGDGSMDFIHPGSDRVVRGLTFTEGCNYPFSGLTADASKDCLWRLAVEMYTDPSSDLYGARQPLFVHDENVLECPRAAADKVAARLERVMIDVYADWCPDVPIKVDIHIAERYGKK